ncbi:MAG: hypothetical protein IJ759_04735 [Bacteroidales bacterium]|nr:hypothetical protein [Bacteroidales bacterium]
MAENTGDFMLRGKEKQIVKCLSYKINNDGERVGEIKKDSNLFCQTDRIL